MALKGFNCKQCGKPFFALIDTPENIKDDQSAIRKYEDKGHQFVTIPNDSIAKFDGWCQGHKENGLTLA